MTMQDNCFYLAEKNEEKALRITMSTPKIRLRIPEEIALATDNSESVPLHLVPTADMLIGPDNDVLDRNSFRQIRDTLGAYIVTSVPEMVRHALGVPAGEPGIL
jgi:hypothetical protein